MLAVADLVDLVMHEFPRLGGRRLALALVLASLLDRSFVRHRRSPMEIRIERQRACNRFDPTAAVSVNAPARDATGGGREIPGGAGLEGQQRRSVFNFPHRRRTRDPA